MKFNANKLIPKFITGGLMAGVCSMAFASVGGLTVAQTTADSIKTALYGVVGVVALIYMIYLGVMAFTEKKSWADFGWGVVHVSLVGGSIALGTWAWGVFA